MSVAAHGPKVTRRRVHVDIAGGRPVHRPDDALDELLSTLLSAGEEVCVVDLDRSRRISDRWDLLDAAITGHPDRLWVAGHISSAAEAVRMLRRGAAGVVLGSGLLAAALAAEDSATVLDPLVAACPADRIAISLDRIDTSFVEAGFTRPLQDNGQDIHARVLSRLPDGVSVCHVNAGASLYDRDASGVEGKFLKLYPGLEHWYAGNVKDWATVGRLAALGVHSILGAHYLRETLGLPDRVGQP